MPITIRTLETIIRLSDHPEVTPVVENKAVNEIQDQYLSSTLARERLDWSPDHSLEDGLRETIDWYRTYLQ